MSTSVFSTFSPRSSRVDFICCRMPGRLVALTLMMVCAGSDDPSTLTIRFASPSADAADFSAAALIRREDARRAGAGATARRANAARSALLLNAETPKPRELPREIAARPSARTGATRAAAAVDVMP